MAIATGALIAAGIGAASSIGGAALSAKSSKKAATTAAAAQTDATASNNALARELYGYNTANMQPFMQSGQRANRMLDSFLYGGGGDTANITGGQQGYGAPPPSQGGEFLSYGTGGSMAGTGGLEPRPTNNLVTDIDRIAPLYGLENGAPQGNPTGPYGLTPGGFTPYQGQAEGVQMIPGTDPNGGRYTTGVAATGQPGQTAQNAWDTFRNSTNYQFRFGEGMDAVQQQYAGAGALQSGAAMKDITRFGQNFASNELNNYLGLLQGQQALGAGSASALAGVSQNYGNQVMQNNNNGADALSNAALLRGQANNQMYGGIAQGLGSLASSFKW